MTEALWLLLLIAAVGALCFLAGWRSAKAYMVAAVGISELTKALAEQANSYNGTLDKYATEAASLRAVIEEHQRGVSAGMGEIHGALVTLWNGFERGGLVRSEGRRAPGLQVGEKPPE